MSSLWLKSHRRCERCETRQSAKRSGFVQNLKIKFALLIVVLPNSAVRALIFFYCSRATATGPAPMRDWAKSASADKACELPQIQMRNDASFVRFRTPFVHVLHTFLVTSI